MKEEFENMKAMLMARWDRWTLKYIERPWPLLRAASPASEGKVVRKWSS